MPSNMMECVPKKETLDKGGGTRQARKQNEILFRAFLRAKVRTRGFVQNIKRTRCVHVDGCDVVCECERDHENANQPKKMLCTCAHHGRGVYNWIERRRQRRRAR